ncbi:MAG: SDR family oxidoreductase [Deltaproteobacteria bacterium]|nr:SDR family oxidoreductase [Deltaproteobacteria bacterium]MBF0525331.1 SDR family oxidoreductase [Deltaproteobacteria bacterium]
MDLGLKGKVALVAGASQGLGLSVAASLANEGARVAICSRSADNLKAAAKTIKRNTGATVLTMVADLMDTDQARAFVQESAEQFGRVDILVTNAGGPPPGMFMSFSEDDWLKAFRLNFLSGAMMIREAVPYMKKGRWGRIVNITSISVKQPLDGLVLSNAVRSGVIGLAKTLAKELAEYNILVNNVCPGYTMTERVRSLAAELAAGTNRTPEEIIGDWELRVPLNRLGKPEELADMVVFLASERAGYITGATIQVDGGFFKGLM